MASTDKRNPTENQSNRGPVITGAVIQVPERILEEYRANQKQYQRENKISRRLTVAAVVSAWLLAAIAVWQSYEMRKAADASKLSADAAVVAAAAWVVLDTVDYKGVEKGRAVFEVALKNVGKTPALEVSSAWEFAFLPGPDLVQIPQYKEWQCPKRGVQPGIVASDQGWVTTVTSPLYSDIQIKMFNEKTARLFVHGCATYRDVLTDRSRITEMAFFYPPNNPTNNPAQVGVYAPYSRMK